LEIVEHYALFVCAQTEPWLLVIPGNERFVVVSLNESGLVFALSANTLGGSTGLSQGWLCKYQYHGLPVRPQLLESFETTESSIGVQWTPLGCDNLNKARVFGYVLQFQNSTAGTVLYW